MLTLKSAALAALLATIALAPAIAHADPAPVAAQTVGATKLFADSKLIVQDRISIEVVGHGPDLVFIPGLASSRETWRVTAERLRGHYRLHLIQVNGFAGEPPAANATGDVLIPTAEAIDAYLVEAKLSPAVVIGHSLGGTIGLYLADHHPDHIKKLLVVDALPFYGVVFTGPSATVASIAPFANAIRIGPPPPPASLVKVTEAMVGGEADRARVVGWGRASDPSTVKRALADDLSLDLRPDLATMKTPITIFYPDNAPNGMPAGAGDQFYQAAFNDLTNKTLVPFANSRHFIMYDQPAAFAAALDAFLAK
jgi:pimeloyl-[acyl-carrier protein] methyl ester esterase